MLAVDYYTPRNKDDVIRKMQFEKNAILKTVYEREIRKKLDWKCKIWKKELEKKKNMNKKLKYKIFSLGVLNCRWSVLALSTFLLFENMVGFD